MVQISLVIPAHNVENLVVDTLRSVNQQTLAPSQFEVVVFDDASTDNTHSVAQKLAKEMDNVRVYRGEENRGAATARNKAIKRARGKYIALLDADDLLKPEALEATLGFMKRNPQVRYSYSQFEMVDLDGRELGRRTCLPFKTSDLLHFNQVGAIICFERKLHFAIGGYDETTGTYAEDWDHALRADEYLGRDQIARHPLCLYTYRIHGGSASNAQKDKVRDTGCHTLLSSLRRRGIQADKVFFAGKRGVDNRSHYDWSVMN